MKTFKYAFILLASGLVLDACTKPAEQAPYDLEKAKASIAETNKNFANFSSADSMKIAHLYHSQAMLLPPNSEIISGMDKIASFVSGAAKMGVAGFKLSTSSVWGDADLVVEEGAYEVIDKGGATLETGKYIVLWKEEDGQLKLFRDMWSANMPMQMTAAEKK